MAEVWQLAGRYRLVKSLGAGGFGEVWQAQDAVLGRDVAVKVLKASPGQPEQVRRFQREARIVSGLRHQNVVVIHDAGEDQSTAYLVMELLAGPSLAELLASRGPLPVALALRYAEQAAAGLGAAHAAGVVHHDVKPGNLVVADDGTLKVAGFGLARLAWDTMSATAGGAAHGTPAYLSPEQAAGRPAEPRSDLYSLGCVLYALLVGEPPFTAQHPVALAHQHLTVPPPSAHEQRPEVPPAIDDLLATMLAKSPAERPANAAIVGALLSEMRSGLSPGAWPWTVPIAAVWHEPPEADVGAKPRARRR